MALGMGLTPALNESMGYSQTMLVFAVTSVVLTLLFILFGKENSFEKSKELALDAFSEIKLLLRNRNFFFLFIICLLALGVFNGLTTWLEPILKPNGINAEETGLVGAFLIVGGIVGSVIIPTLSDKFKRRKPFLALCCLVALIILHPLCTLSALSTLYILGGLMGFFFLPGYALLLSMSEEIAGVERAGIATGMLMLAGNAGGVVIIVLMPLVNGSNPIWTNAIYLMIGLMLVSLVIALTGLKETFVDKDKN